MRNKEKKEDFEKERKKQNKYAFRTQIFLPILFIYSNPNVRYFGG